MKLENGKIPAMRIGHVSSIKYNLMPVRRILPFGDMRYYIFIPTNRTAALLRSCGFNKAGIDQMWTSMVYQSTAIPVSEGNAAVPSVSDYLSASMQFKGYHDEWNKKTGEFMSINKE